MSVKLECDRCGVQKQASGVMLLAGHCGPGIPSLRPELPAGWTRPRLPNDDDSMDDRELCPPCKADLFRFMAGQPVTGCTELAPSMVCGICGHSTHNGVKCRELTMPGAPGDVDECGCTEEVRACTGCGHHEGEGCGCPPRKPSRSEVACPGCGHLRHSTRCPDPFPEVGPCGCTELTPRDRMKELGIDD